MRILEQLRQRTTRAHLLSSSGECQLNMGMFKLRKQSGVHSVTTKIRGQLWLLPTVIRIYMSYQHHRVCKTLTIGYSVHSACASLLTYMFPPGFLPSKFHLHAFADLVLAWHADADADADHSKSKFLARHACAIPKNEDCGSFRGTWTAFELVSWWSMVIC